MPGKNEKHYGEWIKIALIMGGLVFVAGQTKSNNDRLRIDVKKKVSLEQYERDRKADREILELHLERIEGKIDAIDKHLKSNPAGYRDQPPGNQI